MQRRAKAKQGMHPCMGAIKGHGNIVVAACCPSSTQSPFHGH